MEAPLPQRGGGNNQTKPFLIFGQVEQWKFPFQGFGPSNPNHPVETPALQRSWIQTSSRESPGFSQNGPGKIPGNAGAVAQGDAERTRGCSQEAECWIKPGNLWEGIFLLFPLKSGRMTCCPHYSVPVKELPIFFFFFEDPGHWHTRVGRVGAAPLLLLFIDYKILCSKLGADSRDPLIPLSPPGRCQNPGIFHFGKPSWCSRTGLWWSLLAQQLLRPQSSEFLPQISCGSRIISLTPCLQQFPVLIIG